MTSSRQPWGRRWSEGLLCGTKGWGRTRKPKKHLMRPSGGQRSSARCVRQLRLAPVSPPELMSLDYTREGKRFTVKDRHVFL